MSRNFGPLSALINGRSYKSFVYLRFDYIKGTLSVAPVVDQNEGQEEIIAEIPSGQLTFFKKIFDRIESRPCLKIYAKRRILFLKLFPVAEKDVVWFGEIIEALVLLTKRRDLNEIEKKDDGDDCDDYESDCNNYFATLKGEYEKIFGESKDKWRFSDLNEKYELCPSYSRVIPIPDSISDTALLHASKFRVQNRFPLLVNIFRGRALIRSGQPLVGLSQKRCVQDEKLIEAIKAAVSSLSQSKIMIFDARPSTSALANTVLGAGVERLECYEGAERFYLNLENIHTVRESHNDICRVMEKFYTDDRDQSTRGLLIEVEDTCSWLNHLSGILEGVCRIVEVLNDQTSAGGMHVLVHCSDGWDRTSQLVSLVQLCLFKEYRSQSGFKRLIMKDWLAGGHRFSLRNSHQTRISPSARLQSTAIPVNPFSSLKRFFQSSSTIDETGTNTNTTNNSRSDQNNNNASEEDSADEECPIFLQFIEAVVHLCRQFPLSFPELTDQFLLKIVDESYAGTVDSEFFGNCEAERKLFCDSAEIENSEILNNEIVNNDQDTVLLPKYDRNRMYLWPAYYKRCRRL